MLEWYKDDELKIYFSHHPVIQERFLCPYCNEQERKEILKKPYKNLEDLKIKIVYENDIFSFSIPKGYCFDGASIPRLFWRLVGSNTDNTFLVAAMVHDFCCENHNIIENNRYLSTLVFNALLEVGGVNKFKRWLMKHSVDNFQKFCGWGRQK